MNTKYYIHSTLIFLILTFKSVMASDHQIPSRLIIGFNNTAYLSLGGASEAADYINNHWGSKKPISLVRPLGNSAILVEVRKPDAENLNEIINKLMQLDTVRYVNEDQPVSHFPSTDLSIPTLQ